jgi:hypothetical protein
MIERLHVKGISPQISKEDVQQLFGKVGIVEEVHRPNVTTTTGDQKNFAIVRIVPNEATFEQTLKQLNNSIWKGCKIRISKANEYYKDKIQRENMENLASPDQSKIKKNVAKSWKRAIFHEELQSPYLRIRRAKGLKMIKTTIKPIIFVDDKAFKFEKENDQFFAKNRKIIFEDQPSKDAILSEYQETTVELPKAVISAATEKPVSTGRIGFGLGSATNKAQAPETEVKIIAAKGVRRGFGEVDCCKEDEELEKFITAKMIENEDLPETSTDIIGLVSEEELRKEQERTMNIMKSLFKNESSGGMDTELEQLKNDITKASEEAAKKKRKTKKEKKAELTQFAAEQEPEIFHLEFDEEPVLEEKPVVPPPAVKPKTEKEKVIRKVPNEPKNPVLFENTQELPILQNKSVPMAERPENQTQTLDNFSFGFNFASENDQQPASSSQVQETSAGSVNISAFHDIFKKSVRMKDFLLL